MFAACLELDLACPLGNQLVLQVKEGQGLAAIPYDQMAIWQERGVTLVQQWQLAHSRALPEPKIAGDADTRVLFWGRLDNAEMMVSRLDSEHQMDTPTSELSDAQMILLAWQCLGEELCQNLVGDFALAIFDSATNEFFLARDHFGIKPLYTYCDESRMVVATSMAVIKALSGIDLEPSSQWMLRYLMGCSADWRDTAYSQITRIQPAHYARLGLESDAPGKIEQKAYFDFSDIEAIALQSDEEYVAQYLNLLNRAVRDRIVSTSAVATECSGGLDSSSVSILAAKWMDNPVEKLHSFAMIFHEQEPEAVSLAHSSFAHASSISLDQQDLASYDWQEIDTEHLSTVAIPVEQGFSHLHVPFYRSAEDRDCKILLSGFGGDEFSTIYGAAARYEFWDQKRYGLLASRFRGGFLSSKLRMIKWLYRLARFGPCTETAQRIMSNAKQNWQSNLLNRDLPGFEEIEAYALEGARYDMGYRNLNDFVLSNRLSPNISARLEACTLMAARYGLEYRWPLLDIRLVSFFLSVPSEQKLGPKAMGRYLHRRAMSGILPDSLCWRDKSMGNQTATENKSKENFEYNKININNNLKNIVNVDYYIDMANKMPEQLSRIQLWQLEKIRRLNEWLDFDKHDAS